MATVSFTLTATQLFPAGTTVKAWPKSAFAGSQSPSPGQQPPGVPAAAEQTMGTTTATLVLSPSMSYYVGGQVGGEWRWLQVRTEPLPEGSAAVAEALAEEALLERMPVFNVSNHGVSAGEADQSVALRALVKGVSENGGGILYFPPNVATPWYRMLEVGIPSNVWIWQAPGVEFRPPIGEIANNKTVLTLGEFGALGFTTNVGSIGLIKVNISEAKPHGSSLNLKAVAFLGLYGCKLAGLRLTGSEQTEGGSHVGTEQGIAFTMANAAGLVATNCDIDTIIATKANCPGGGAIQLGAHKNLHIGSIFSEGGIAARIETDGSVVTTKEQEEGKWRGSDGLIIDSVVCENGFCAFSMIPHTNYIRGETSIGSVTANGCSGGSFIGPPKHGEAGEGGNAGVFEGTVSIRSMTVNGAGATANAEFGGKVQGYFVPGNNQEDFGSMQVNIGSLTVRNVTGCGLWGHTNLTIESVLLEEIGQQGILDHGESAWLAGSYMHLGRVRLINVNSAGSSQVGGFLAAIERVDIDDFEIVDTRGTKNKTVYGLQTYGANPLTVYLGRSRGSGGSGTEGAEYKAVYQANGSSEIRERTVGTWEALVLGGKVEAGAARVPGGRLQAYGTGVDLRGAPTVKSGQTLGAGETLLTLPAALRPGVAMTWSVIYSGGGLHTLAVSAGGVVTLGANLAAGESVGLDATSFGL